VRVQFVSKEKMKVAEIIVVEGKDDTRRIQEVVEADTIETIGSAINPKQAMSVDSRLFCHFFKG
jgi:5S rRNA maturation endonuclease (ribonuclease M5)